MNAALRRHDWSSEFSDDMRTVRRGQDALAWLQQERLEIDPRGTIWNSICPASHRFSVEVSS